MAGALSASGSSGSRIRLIAIALFGVFLLGMAVLPSILFKPQPLQVNATANPRSGPAPLTVFFMGSAGGGSGQLRFRWDFGDENSSSEESPKHTYQFPGTFNATLQVWDLRETRVSSPIQINSTTTSLGVAVNRFAMETGPPCSAMLPDAGLGLVLPSF